MHRGVPIGVIFGSTAALMLIIAVSYPGWPEGQIERSGRVTSTNEVPSLDTQLSTTN